MSRDEIMYLRDIAGSCARISRVAQPPSAGITPFVVTP